MKTEQMRIYSSNPLLLCLLGWALFVAMYALVGVFSLILGFEVTPSFKLFSPLGLGGLFCWCASIWVGLSRLRHKSFKLTALLSIIASVLSITLLAYVIWLLVYGF